MYCFERTRQHARIVFHQRCLTPKVLFHRRLSSTEGHLPPKVILHRRLSSTKGCLPPKVVFHQRSSSTEGCLSPKAVFHQRSTSTYHNTLVDVTFVSTVNVPNLSPRGQLYLSHFQTTYKAEIWYVDCSHKYKINLTVMSHATLRFYSLAEQCHTQNFYLRCFNSDFDAVKSKFGLVLE